MKSSPETDESPTFHVISHPADRPREALTRALRPALQTRMPLLEKIERIAWDCGVDPHQPMAKVVREANEMMGLSAEGTLMEQAEALLETMGVAIPPARPMPIRKARRPASTSVAQAVDAIDLDEHDSMTESPAGPASDGGEDALADARKKKKRTPPLGLLANEEMDASRAGDDEEPAVSPASDSSEHRGMNGSQPPCDDEPEDGMRPASCSHPAESSGSSTDGTGPMPAL